jgi:hypothetical protein
MDKQPITKDYYMKHLTYPQLYGKMIHSGGDLALLINLNKEFTLRADEDIANGKTSGNKYFNISGNELGKLKSAEMIKKANKGLAEAKGSPKKLEASGYTDYKALYLKERNAKNRLEARLNREIEKLTASRQRLKDKQ